MRDLELTFGISVGTVYAIRDAFGITGPSVAFPGKTLVETRPKKPRLSAVERHPGILDALRERRSLAEIGAQYGITHQRVSQIAKRHGIQKPAITGSETWSAEGLTVPEQRHVKNHPDILNPNLPASAVAGVRCETVRRIRHKLCLPDTPPPAPTRDSVLASVVQPMTIPEIRAAIAPRAPTNIISTLSRYIAQGHLKRLSPGIYAPANWPEEGSP